MGPPPGLAGGGSAGGDAAAATSAEHLSKRPRETQAEQEHKRVRITAVDMPAGDCASAEEGMCRTGG